MNLVLHWAYPARGQISYLTGIGLALLVLMLITFKPQQITKSVSLELAAFIEMTEPVTTKSSEKSEPVREHLPTRPVLLPTPVKVSEKTVSTQSMPIDQNSFPESHDQTAQTSAAVSESGKQDRTSDVIPKLETATSKQENVSKQSPYESRLLAYLEQIKRYPSSREARQTRPQGVVKVWLEINRAGQLLSAGVLTSSGSNLLDGEALRTLRSGSFPPIPDTEYAGQATHRFSASLKYTLD